MHPLVVLSLTLLAAYLVGGIPFGYLVARWRGVNIFEQGSGNIGATNVGRILGRRWGLLVFALDFAKGALPVLAALIVGSHHMDRSDPLIVELMPVGAGLAALLGHIFSPYLGFRGGKGVATGAGVVLVLFPIPTLGALVAWLAVVSASRIVSLGSLVAAVTLCAIQLGLTSAYDSPAHVIRTAFCFLAAALVFVRHRANIRRLLQGTENRLPESPAMHQLTKTLHVLSLGLWFGSAVFFLLIAAVSLFQTFETLGAAESRPDWFPVKGTIYAYRDDIVDGPREQGARAAGAAVGPLFLWFFMLQGGCGVFAAATSLGWSRIHRGARVHHLRTWLLLAALAAVLLGWPLERYVAQLRAPRDQAIDNYLVAQENERPSRDLSLQVLATKREFFAWHMASMALSFGTLVLLAWGMVLAARLPTAPSPPVPAPTP